MIMEDLNVLRRIYRTRLSRYAWARRVKPIALALWFKYLHLRHVVDWKFRYQLHVLSFVLRQRLHAFGLGAARAKRRLTEEGSYKARMGAHALGLGAAHAKRRLVEEASYKARTGAYPSSTGATTVRVRLSEHATYRFMLLLGGIVGGLGGMANKVAFWLQPSTGAGPVFFLLTSFDEYRNDNKISSSSTLLTEAVDLRIPMPIVFPEAYRQNLYSETWLLDVPPVRVMRVSDAEVMGKCDFIFSERRCLHHGLYRFDRDLSMEEMHGLMSINSRRNMAARYRKEGHAIEEIPEAISLIGSASANYVHWLTETAPKLALIDRMDCYADLPLIIDDGLHPNIMESLDYLNIHNRALIPIKSGQLFRVDKLVSISPVAYVPFDFKAGMRLGALDIDPGFAMYVPDGVNSVRQLLVSRFSEKDVDGGKKLYLRRTAKSRQMANSEEVEAFVLEHGFQIVEPETLSFAEQVKLFSRAEMIVGQGGAAFGNIVFAPKNCRIVILTTWSPFTIYYYFSNLASVLGQQCCFVLCEPVEEPDGFHLAHKGLRVAIQDLRGALEL